MRYILSFLILISASAASACELTKEGWSFRLGGAIVHEVERCAAAGFDFNSLDEDGDPVFHLMVSVVGAPEAILIALNAGADPNLPDRFGSASFVDMLNFSAPEDDVSVAGKLELLGQAGADFSLTDNHDYTALGRAVSKRFDASVEVLLRYGADPNQLSTYGRAPLFNTVFGRCQPQMGETLIDAGARLDVMGDDVVARLFEEAEEACTDGAGQAYIVQLETLAGR